MSRSHNGNKNGWLFWTLKMIESIDIFIHYSFIHNTFRLKRSTSFGLFVSYRPKLVYLGP